MRKNYRSLLRNDHDAFAVSGQLQGKIDPRRSECVCLPPTRLRDEPGGDWADIATLDGLRGTSARCRGEIDERGRFRHD